MLANLPLFQLQNPAIRAARIAVVTSTIAGLAVLGACADATKTISPVDGPRNSTIQSGGLANSGTVRLCVDASSPAGTYQFTNSGIDASGHPTGIAINGTADGGDGGSGVSTANAPGGVAYPVAVGSCITVLTRTTPDNGFPGSASCPTLGAPGCTGFTDTWSGITVTATSLPTGVVYNHTDCLLDAGVRLPDPNPCGTSNNPTRAFMNTDHGTQLTFFFTAAPVTGHNCTFTQGYYKNHDAYTAGVLSSNVSTTYIDASGKLIIGTYHLTAAQIDAILQTPVGKGYNSGGVVFTKDQLAMIHQLITAELNISGGASSATVAATISAANAGYTTATKAQLDAWNNTLDAFNNGNNGPPHCS